MLGLQGNASSSKVYRCVACSATFNGLASLLVHQASHATSLAKAPGSSPQPVTSPHETPVSSMEPSSQRPNPSALCPDSPSFYICDCGEEFLDFSLMLEHKRSHVPQIELLDENCSVSNQVFPSQHVSFSPPLIPSGLGPGRPSTSKSPPVEQPKVTDHNTDVSQGITPVTTSEGHTTAPPNDVEKQLDQKSAREEKGPETEDEHLQDLTNSTDSTEVDERAPRNGTLMKMLASAYMKCPEGQSPDSDDGELAPKLEEVPVDVTPGANSDVSSVNDLSIAQLRRLLTKPGIKTKAPPISKILESTKKKVVSLTNTFSPVVVLETRQKLIDSVGNSTYGSYQCGRCRRVFQNLDKLTEHHLLHRKERIKCCRRCKQLIIGRLPLPDNHVCPQLVNRTIQSSNLFKGRFPSVQKIVPFHRLGNTKKVFYCPLCKHSYARRWNLKMHKCQGSASPNHFNTATSKMIVLRSNNTLERNTAGSHRKSIAVGTEVTGRIKVELNPDSGRSAVTQLAWTPPARRFPPFSTKQSVIDQHKESAGRENSWDAAGVDCSGVGEGQWTVPLDDELEVLSSAGKVGKDGELNAAVSVSQTTPTTLHYFVSGGVKRYPCSRCQKTYSRANTLRRHLRLCGFRPRGLAAMTQSAAPPNSNKVKPMFPCAFCGRSFNRKDNMMVHSRKCQLRRTVPDVDRGVVPLQPQSLSSCVTDSKSPDADGGNWGFMSLPSVLPRRVTCECGVGFTSPRLLLEHLQKHAQESYTCPTCGETVNSWADYEVHLQIHMHPHHPLLKGLQPQRSQPLLLRFQQQPPAQQTPPPPPTQPVGQPRSEQLPTPPRTHQKIVCSRCGNTFATRCSLRRHLSWNRCKGARLANPSSNPPKAYHCSHCNSDFPNTISLIFHQRSGACKPAIKPVRCPVCARWFSTMDGLQKHLLTHKKSDSYRCDVCQGTYSTLKSLKNHRRRVHRIMAGELNLQKQDQLTS